MPRRAAETLTDAVRVDRFLLRVEELRDRRLIADKLTVSLTLSGDGHGVCPVLGAIDIEDLRSLLVVFRLFISNDEPVFRNKIFNLCQRHLTDAAVKQCIADARACWDAINRRVGIQATGNVTLKVEQPTWYRLGLHNPSMPHVPPPMQLQQPIEVSLTVQSRGRPVTWEDATTLMINTTFHDDPERVAEYNRLTPEEQIVVQAMFRFHLVEAIGCILWLGNALRIARDQQLFDWQRAV